MAESSSHHSSGSPKPTTDAKRSNSISGILSKSFLFLLLIVGISLFPSQASNFIIQSLVSKSWELFPLLIIGVVVSYALFCRRNVEVGFEPSPNFDDSQSSLVSRVFQVCPVFEDGYKNSDVGFEGIVHQSRDSPDNCYKGDDFDSVTIGGFDGSLKSGVGFGISVENGQSSKIHAWNYESLEGVVMSKESNELAGNGESPRSLNSETVCAVSPRFGDGSRYDSSLEESSWGSSKRCVIEKEFGDMGPKNLEGEFNEDEVSSSEILEHSRIGRVEPRQKVGSGGTNSSHLRPLSMDETQLESLKSQSLWSAATSLSSQASSMPHSPTRLSQSSSVSTETILEMEELGKSKTFGASQSPLKTINGEAPLNAFHLRRYSNGPLFSKNVQVSPRDKLKASSGSRRDDSLRSNRERQQESKKPDMKPETKASSKGKSVRTLATGDVVKSQTDFGFGTSIEVKAAELMRDETKSDTVGLLFTQTPKRNADPKPVHEGYQKKEQTTYHENTENATADTKEGSQRGTESFQVTSGGDDVIETMRRDSGCDSNEVDRRAGEFIAKFREHMMLQKAASMERSRQRRKVANHLR